MADLYHVGVSTSAVPRTIVLVDPALPLADVLAPLSDVRALGRRREYESAVGTWAATSTLVTSVGVGCPPLAIAIEELARAGAQRMVLLAATALRAAAATDSWLLPCGAVRGEGTTAHYAPAGFPAVPDARLLQLLSARLAGRATWGIVETVDLVPDGAARPRPPILAIETRCAALFVVAAARRVSAGAVLTDDSAAGLSDLAAAVYRCLDDAQHPAQEGLLG